HRSSAPKPVRDVCSLKWAPILLGDGVEGVVNQNLLTERVVLTRAASAQRQKVSRSPVVSGIQSAITAITPHRVAMSVAAAGLLVHVVLVAFHLFQHEGRIEYFVHFGEQSPVMTLARRTLGNEVLVPHLDGHDGQFFWVQAHDPLLLHGKSTGKFFDVPTYRAQRLA